MREAEFISLAHGAGGRASAELIDEIFIKAFATSIDGPLQDSALLAIPEMANGGAKLAFTTDSFVVSPTIFPGGNIGKLAVCGTVNDLAVSGAKPLYMSASFILEEGLPITELRQIVTSMAQTADQANVSVVTGDTKVVAKGQVDKVFINTAGVGVVPEGTQISIDKANDGDVVLVNGHIGDHGAAIMLARQEMGLQADLNSDCAPLNSLIQRVLDRCPNIKVMRDATRGGVGTVLSEIAHASGVAIALDEANLPIRNQTHAICELLGMEPLFFANEGLIVICVPEDQADIALKVMQSDPHGEHACQIGSVTKSQQSLLYINTRYGSKRMLETPYGIQLPRIC